jgi:hypothetical protein
LSEELLSDICEQILEIDKSMRFAGIANNMGSLVVTTYRQGLVPLMTSDETSQYATQAVLRPAIREDFEIKLGRLQYSIGKYEKLIRATVPILLSSNTDHESKFYLFLSFDKYNFSCAVKDDFIRNDTYKCGLCVSNNVNECYHRTVDYGPCISNEFFKNRGCKYRTFPEDYTTINKGTREEKVFIDDDTTNHLQTEYSQWPYLENLKERKAWRACDYYHQLNIALSASHSTLNYSMFLSLLPTRFIVPR